VVTLACVFVAVTAFLTLTELITALMDWATVDMQTWLRPVLTQLAAAGATVTMAEILYFLRWFFLAMVPFSVAAMVFAIYALRGDRTARVMTTILAVAAGFVSLPIGVFGVLQATMLFLAAGALWSSDASRWYRGEPSPEAPATAADAPPAEPQLPESLPASAPAAAPRPTSVTVAGLLAILGSIATAMYSAVVIALYNAGPEVYVEILRKGLFGDLMTTQELEFAMQISLWSSLVMLPLALVGILVGAALLSRRRTSRRAALWWAWATATVGILMLPFGLPAVVVIVLLLRDDARRWTASR
jgi:hypothetical protein